MLILKQNEVELIHLGSVSNKSEKLYKVFDYKKYSKFLFLNRIISLIAFIFGFQIIFFDSLFLYNYEVYASLVFIGALLHFVRILYSRKFIFLNSTYLIKSAPFLVALDFILVFFNIGWMNTVYIIFFRLPEQLNLVAALFFLCFAVYITYSFVKSKLQYH